MVSGCNYPIQTFVPLQTFPLSRNLAVIHFDKAILTDYYQENKKHDILASFCFTLNCKGAVMSQWFEGGCTPSQLGRQGTMKRSIASLSAGIKRQTTIYTLGVKD